MVQGEGIALLSLILPSPLYDQLRAHGEETYPHECCGIMLGKSDGDDLRVAQLLRAGNTRTDSAHNRYNIAPQELIAAQREGRKQGLDIVGFYHSHPDHRGPLVRLRLRHHRGREGPRRHHQQLPAHRLRRRRQGLHRPAHRSYLTETLVAAIRRFRCQTIHR